MWHWWESVHAILALHVVLENDASTDFVDKSFIILPTLLANATVKDGAVGKHGGETFVVEVDGHAWDDLLQSVSKLDDALLILRRLTIGLRGQTDNESLHRLFGNVVFEKLHEFLRVDRCESVGNDLCGVSHRDACALFAVVDGEDAHDFWG